jgi:CDP-diacylglycerol---serine O-phosphatidyltransferase
MNDPSAPHPRASRTVKKIAIIPTLLTLGNGVCGFAAIAFASKITPNNSDAELFTLSAWLIIAAMLFDALDGYAARLAKTASEFGGQLDSLCDAVSFGAAPAFLLLRLGLNWAETPFAKQSVAVIAALYMVCAILRLARFNVETSPDPLSHKRFKGLPSPAAAGCVVSLALLRGEPVLRGGPTDSWLGMNGDLIRAVIDYWAPVGALVVALLMVSRFPYPHLTNQLLRGRRRFSYVVQIVVVVFLITLFRELAVVLSFWAYAISAPLGYGVRRLMRGTNVAPHPLDDQTRH